MKKLEMQETNRIYLYQDVEFHPHPQLATLQAASKYFDFVACTSSYHFTVMMQGVYNEPMISTYPSYIASQTSAFDIYTSIASSPGVLCL